MYELPEKPKRQEKPKGRYRRNWLYISTGIGLILVGVVGLLLLTPVRCYPGSSVFEMTTTSIVATNQWVYVKLSETSVALTAPQMPEETDGDNFASMPGHKEAMAAVTAVAYAALAEQSPDCFYTWHIERDTEATQRLQSDLNRIHMENAAGYVLVRGKMYVCGTGAARTTQFAAADTTLKFVVRMADSAAVGTMGATIDRLLRAVDRTHLFDPHEVQILFDTAGTDSSLWKMDFAAALKIISTGKNAAELYQAGMR